MVESVSNTSSHPDGEVRELVIFATNRSGVDIANVQVYDDTRARKRGTASATKNPDDTFSIRVCPDRRYEWEETDWRESLVYLLAQECRRIADWGSADEQACKDAGEYVLRLYRDGVASNETARQILEQQKGNES